MKRNILVIAAVLATLGIMIWAGVANFNRQKKERADLKRLQALIESTQPQGSADQGDDGIEENPLQGQMAPNFTLPDTKGQKISLANYKGKAVVIDFWATWCPPCKVEIPWLEQFNQQYSGQGLQVLGISEDDLNLDNKTELAREKKQIADIAGQLKINYPVLYDDANVSAPYGGVDGLPTTFFIDRSGKVVASTVGLAPREEIEADIKKALSNGGGES